MLSMRHRMDSCELGLHRMFLAAPEEVVHALAEWIRDPQRPRSRQIIRGFIRTIVDAGASAPRPRKQCIFTQGEVYDLVALFAGINAADFEGAITARITWGRWPATRGPRRSIRFGSYSAREQIIRIHPVLDQDFVPRHFIRYIVFHEMLHALLGVPRSAGGRRQVHCQRFREIERAWPGYAEALAWQANPVNMRRLLK